MVNDAVNIFVIDGFKNTLEGVKNLLNNASVAKEKLVLSLENISKNGKKIALDYPLTFELFDGNSLVSSVVLKDNTSFKPLFTQKKSGTYTLQIRDKNNNTIQKELVLLPDVPVKIDTHLGSSVLQT